MVQTSFTGLTLLLHSHCLPKTIQIQHHLLLLSVAASADTMGFTSRNIWAVQLPTVLILQSLSFQQRQFPDVFLLLILQSLCFHLGWQLIKSQVQSQSEFSSSSKTSEPPRFVIISITFSQILEKPRSFSILRNNLQYCLDFSTVPVHKSIWMAKMH